MLVITHKPRSMQPKPAPLAVPHRAQSRWGAAGSLWPLQRQVDRLDTDPALVAPPSAGRDFSPVPVRAAAAGAIQAKLTVSQPDDPFEVEADRLAEQVMRAPEPRAQQQCACGGLPGAAGKCEQCGSELPTLQRKTSNAAGPLANNGVPGLVDEVLGSPASPLDPAIRRFMEARTGYNFARVRIHSDARAAASAESVAARAYTVGHHVVFAAGQFAPGTAEGRRLIAHELVHVMQQGGAAAAAPSATLVSTSRTPAPGLQRQQCDPAKDTIQTGPLPTTLPNVACNPTPQTLQQVRATPGSTPTILGITTSGASTDQIEFAELSGSRCRASVLQLAQPVLQQSVYVKEGDFDDGTEPTPATPANRPCAGKTVRRVMRITAAAAAKLRRGEAEHCEDMKLAFALSWGKFNQASKDLEGEYCAAHVHVNGADTICDKEFATRFSARTGVAWANREQVANCLLGKSKLRDDPPNRWHDVVPTDGFYAKDCSAVTYIYTAASAPEVDRHPSSEIVKGCGEH